MESIEQSSLLGSKSEDKPKANTITKTKTKTKTKTITSSSPSRIVNKPKYWSPEEDKQLLQLILVLGHKGWKRISILLSTDKTPDQCCQRWHRVLNPHINHADWSAEEDALLAATTPLYPPGNWRGIARHIPGRTGQQCRYRWRHINKDGSASDGAAATKEGTATMSSSSSGSTDLQSSFQPIPNPPQLPPALEDLASIPSTESAKGHSADELEIACHLSALSSVCANPLQASNHKEIEDDVANDDEETIDEAQELCRNRPLQPHKVVDAPEAKSVSKMSISWLIS